MIGLDTSVLLMKLYSIIAIITYFDPTGESIQSQ